MSEILSLVRPNVPMAAANASISAFSNIPLVVSIQSPALLSILESSLRTKGNTRTIGALLGQKSEDSSEISIEDSYIIPHEEKDDEVTIEEHTHKNLFQLYKKHSPDAQIVGWFQTSDELDNVTSLVHDFFNSPESVHKMSAVHLTLRSRDVSGNAVIPQINTYVTTPVGSSSLSAASFNSDDFSSTKLFTPVPHKIVYDKSESLALKFSMQSEDSLTKLEKPHNELVVMENTLSKARELLDANIAFVEKIVAGEIVVDDKVDKIGKFLVSNLVLYTSNYQGFTRDFNKFVRDGVMIEYLVSCLKTQIELSSKLGSAV